MVPLQANFADMFNSGVYRRIWRCAGAIDHAPRWANPAQAPPGSSAGRRAGRAGCRPALSARLEPPRRRAPQVRAGRCRSGRVLDMLSTACPAALAPWLRLSAVSQTRNCADVGQRVPGPNDTVEHIGVAAAGEAAPISSASSSRPARLPATWNAILQPVQTCRQAGVNRVSQRLAGVPSRTFSKPPRCRSGSRLS